MNLRSRLESVALLLSKDRMVGYTTLAAKAAKELGATMLAHNFAHARQIERSYGVKAKSIDQNLMGTNDFYIIDHYAVATLLNRAATKIANLEKENEEMRSHLTLNGIRAMSIKRSLRETGGDVETTAKEFAMTVKALRIMMKDLGIEP